MREHLSQSVFARYLNVSKNLISDWERGVKRPGGPALRLLTLIERSGIQAIASQGKTMSSATYDSEWHDVGRLHCGIQLGWAARLYMSGP